MLGGLLISVSQRALYVHVAHKIPQRCYHPWNARGRHRTKEFALHRRLSGGHWVFNSETGGGESSVAGGGRYSSSIWDTEGLA